MIDLKNLDVWDAIEIFISDPEYQTIEHSRLIKKHPHYSDELMKVYDNGEFKGSPFDKFIELSTSLSRIKAIENLTDYVNRNSNKSKSE